MFVVVGWWNEKQRYVYRATVVLGFVPHPNLRGCSVGERNRLDSVFKRFLLAGTPWNRDQLRWPTWSQSCCRAWSSVAWPTAAESISDKAWLKAAELSPPNMCPSSCR